MTVSFSRTDRKEFAMQVRDVMTPNAKFIPPDATIVDAAKMMRDLDVGALPVCDGDRLCGMITDRDIVIRAVAEG
jgi:CBS domain-containing protein